MGARRREGTRNPRDEMADPAAHPVGCAAGNRWLRADRA